MPVLQYCQTVNSDEQLTDICIYQYFCESSDVDGTEINFFKLLSLAKTK